MSSALEAIRAAALAAAEAAKARKGATMTCPQKAVGRLIGKKGENIIFMSRQFECQVNVDQSLQTHACISISGKDPEKVILCQNYISSLLADSPGTSRNPSFIATCSSQRPSFRDNDKPSYLPDHSNPPYRSPHQPPPPPSNSTTTDRSTNSATSANIISAPAHLVACPKMHMNVPEKSVGLVIGQKGSVIQATMKEFDVFMKVDQLTKVLLIQGKAENTEKAAQRVQDIINGVFSTSIIQFAATESNQQSQAYFKYQTDILSAFAEKASEVHAEKVVWLLSEEDGQKVLGKRGNLLKQIRKQSAAIIQMQIIPDEPGNLFSPKEFLSPEPGNSMEISSPEPTDSELPGPSESKQKCCLLTIAGPEFAVSRAMQMIYEKIPVSRVTVVQPMGKSAENPAWTAAQKAKHRVRKIFFTKKLSNSVKRKIATEIFPNTKRHKSTQLE